MNPKVEYLMARDEQIKENRRDKELELEAHHFFEQIVRTNYVKNFTWMGVPILQLPSDLMVMQEIIYKIRPTMIVETGVAFGGMTLFYAEMLKNTWPKTATSPIRRVIGIDIKFYQHTLSAIQNSRYSTTIKLIEKSSIDKSIGAYLKYRRWTGYGDQEVILVSIDSNHTHDHVLAELRLYSPLVSVGSYIVVFDTTIETYGHFDPKRNKRPWGPGNNPATAVRAFLKENDSFVVDKEVEQRALITAAPGGWLRRVK